jgi:quercetin dioxygenase-like cupin family protein
MHAFRLTVLAASILAVTFGVTSAQATPASGVSGTILAKGTSTGTVKVKSRGATDIIFREITIQPGGTTGWHYHDGQLIAVVKSGSLTRYFDDCSTETTSAGGTVVEPAGRNHVHMGKNLGTEPVVLYVTYVLPKGAPLAQDAPAPKCVS